MTLLERDVVAAGPRVRIRPFTREDVDRWQAWGDYDEPLIQGASPRRLPPDQRARWFEDLTQRQRQIPFAIDDEHDQFIGRLFLRQAKPDEGSAVLGIDLAPDKLGLRYGTEALACFLYYFFEGMGFQRMLLSVAAYNERARRSYDALGFRSLGSHWDAHTGPDASKDRRLREVAHLFRRSALGVETIFYDMVLERDAWERRHGRWPGL